ncbi:MAG: hypothetical protein SCK28_12650 [Bacillota bacterium]|nr:hypothetical protein [Bacillota bacterium]
MDQNENQLDMEAAFSIILAEPMEPGKKRLFRELYRLNRQVEDIKEKLSEANSPITRVKLKKKQKELQQELLHYFQTIENYKSLH